MYYRLNGGPRADVKMFGVGAGPHQGLEFRSGSTYIYIYIHT